MTKHGGNGNVYLNLALQNVSLCQKEMSLENEPLIHNKTTMKEIHETIHNHSELQGALRDSVAAPTIALRQRILALTLKGEKFAVHTTASDQEIDDCFNTHFH